MALNALSALQAASAALGILLSAKTMAAMQVASETGMRSEAAAAVLPRRVQALQAWRLFACAAELTAFAGVSQAVLGGEWGMTVVVSVLAPSCCMFGFPVSALAIPAGDSGWPQSPGAPGLLLALLRLGAWLLLCVGVDRPQGLLGGSGTLGRPMGWRVLEEAFLQPAATVAEATAACAVSAGGWAIAAGKGALDCKVPETHGMSSGTMLFRALLLLLCVSTTLLYVLGILGNLLLNGPYRRADVDGELTIAVEEKQAEIEAWADAQKEIAYSSLPDVEGTVRESPEEPEEQPASAPLL
mmetsp:Transcript_54064/g.137324  ORF Transcript_54064/g.137324 Transcript_54064/m.137324 type:complete len:299 (-) Transcript_54064:134-1030(-)